MGEIGEGQIPKVHSTLQKQQPARPILTPDKSAEMDYAKASEPETHLEVDFDKLLTKEAELKAQVRPAPEVWKLFSQAKRQGVDTHDLFVHTLSRVAEETNLLHELEETGVLSHLIMGLDNGKIGRALVTWNSKSTEGEEAGYYDPLTEKIEIREPLPLESNLVLDLASFGNMDLSTLQHEMTHSLQYAEGSALKRILSVLRDVPRRNDMMHLQEAQAYRTEEGPDIVTIMNIVDKVISTKDDVYKGVGFEKMFAAVTSVDQLNALGFTIPEVGAILRKTGSWDEKKGVFKGVQKVIDEKRNQLNLSEGDLDNLVLADKIERRIDKLHAQVIAQEEMRKAVTSSAEAA